MTGIFHRSYNFYKMLTAFIKIFYSIKSCPMDVGIKAICLRMTRLNCFTSMNIIYIVFFSFHNGIIEPHDRPGKEEYFEIIFAKDTLFVYKFSFFLSLKTKIMVHVLIKRYLEDKNINGRKQCMSRLNGNRIPGIECSHSATPPWKSKFFLSSNSFFSFQIGHCR